MRLRRFSAIATLLAILTACHGGSALSRGGTSDRDVSLLLGLAERQGTNGPDRLMTRWIRFEGTRNSEQEFRGLVVPRDSGFLRIGTTRYCATDSVSSEPRTHCADSVWVHPDLRTELPQAVSIEDPCTSDYIRIDFASATVISVLTHEWRSDCERRSFADGNIAAVLRVPDLRAVAFSTLGPGAETAYRTAARAARNTSALDDGPPGEQSEHCRAAEDEDTGWRIERRKNRWSAAFFQQHLSEACILEAPIEWQLTPAFLGVGERMLDWSALSREIPGLEMAFLSPRGDLAVAVLPTVVRIYSLIDDRLERQLIEYARHDVVMVQWAYGREAHRWDRLLSSIR